MTYTVEEAKQILNCDPDYPDFKVQEMLESADEQLRKSTGFDYGNSPTPLSKKYVRMYILQEYNNSVEYNKEYDFTQGMSSLLVQLSVGVGK